MSGEVSMPPIRVAFITSVPVLGGAELSLLRVLPYLQQVGISPIVVMAPPGGGLLERYQAAGFRTRAFRLYSKSRRSPWRYCQTLYELAVPIALGNVHLVHVNHHYALEYTTIAARLARRPYIVHVRGIETRQWVMANQKYLQDAHGIIAVSQAVKERLMEVRGLSTEVKVIHNGVQAFSRPSTMRQQEPPSQLSRTRVIYDGVDATDDTSSTEPARGALRRDLHVPDHAPLIGLVARLEPLKGVSDFLRACEIVSRTLDEAYFVVTGTGEPEYIAELHQLAKCLGIEERVTFTGFRTDVKRLLQALDVLVVATYDPATSQGESLSNIALESMVARTPVVARRAGGIVEVLADERGILVDPIGVQPLADGIQKVLNLSDAQKKTLTERGYQAVRTQFALEDQAYKIRELYDTALGGNG